MKAPPLVCRARGLTPSYRESGGVHGAVARLAETAYAQLDASERRIARNVMLRLAGGEADAVVRQRVPLAELEQINGADRVVAKLTDAGLLTITDGEVELCHEALLREWPRYRTWLEEDRSGRRLRAHLMSSAREWESTGRDPGELYRGARLTGALDWAAHNDDQLNALGMSPIMPMWSSTRGRSRSAKRCVHSGTTTPPRSRSRETDFSRPGRKAASSSSGTQPAGPRLQTRSPWPLDPSQASDSTRLDSDS